MKKLLVPAVMTIAVCTAASAADLKDKIHTKAPPPAPVAASPWDVAIGAAVASDYNFRGISQSDRGPAGFAYFEARYNSSSSLQWYAGIAAASVKLVTDPSAEIDFYGGVRPTFGPLALDFGLMYYYYPNEQQQFSNGVFVTSNPLVPGVTPYTVKDTDFLEFYAKGTYTVNDNFAFGGAVYYTADWLGLNADGTYAAANVKFTAPTLANGVGSYLSAEIGKYWFGTGDFFGAPLTIPDYTTWNVGIGFTYKSVTLDLRYYDTDATKAECFLLTSDISGVNNGTGTSNWCSAAFVGKLSFDTTLSALK